MKLKQKCTPEDSTLYEVQPHDITFLVLCGGQGRRVNGQDKPLIPWQGQPLVDYVLASVPPWMPKLISANRSIEQYATRAPVLTDEVAGIPSASGPLVGVLAGLQACQTRWLLVAPGDSPKLSDSWWQHLAAPHQGAGISQPRVVFDGTRQQHLHLLLPVSCVSQLREYLLQGGYAVHRWLDEVRAVRVAVANAAQFANFNSPADFAGASPRQ